MMQVAARTKSAQQACTAPSGAAVARPVPRRVACRTFDDSRADVEVPDGFRLALQEALNRQKEQQESSSNSHYSSDNSSSSSAYNYDRSSWRTSDSSSGGSGSSSSYSSWRSNGNASNGSGTSSSGSSSSYSPSGGRSWRSPVPQEEGNNAAVPLLQVLATALTQSRTTLERLQAEEAEIENLIQKEQKQVERLEWLMEKVHQDYAYFNGIEKRFNDAAARTRESNYTNGANNFGSSSSSGDYRW